MAKNSSPGKDEQITKIIGKKILLLEKIKLSWKIKELFRKVFVSTNISGKDKISFDLHKNTSENIFRRKNDDGTFFEYQKEKRKMFYQLYNCFFNFFSFPTL